MPLEKPNPKRASAMSFFSGPPRFLAAIPRISVMPFKKDNANVGTTREPAVGFADVPLDQPISSEEPRLRRNRTEKKRLQALVHEMNNRETSEGGVEGGMKRTLGKLEQVRVWMVNEGEPTSADFNLDIVDILPADGRPR